MAPERKSSAAPVLIVLGALLLPLVAYVAGYFWLGRVDYMDDATTPNSIVIRSYPYAWQVVIFTPASKLEQTARDREVWIR
jgi:hypothetical protein